MIVLLVGAAVVVVVVVVFVVVVWVVVTVVGAAVVVAATVVLGAAGDSPIEHAVVVSFPPVTLLHPSARHSYCTSGPNPMALQLCCGWLGVDESSKEKTSYISYVNHIFDVTTCVFVFPSQQTKVSLPPHCPSQ